MSRRSPRWLTFWRGGQSGFCEHDPNVTRAGGSEPQVGQRSARLTQPGPAGRAGRGSAARMPNLPPESPTLWGRAGGPPMGHSALCVTGLAAPGDGREVMGAGLCPRGTRRGH